MRDHLHLPEGWTSLILLLLLLLTMAVMLVASGLADELFVMPIVVLAAVPLGFIITRLRLPGPLAHPLGLILGTLCGFLILSLTVPLPPWQQMAGAQEWWQELALKGQIMAQRLTEWWATAQQGGASSDPLPFAVQMTALTWLISFYGVWFLFRSHWVWGAILPAGVTIFIGVYYGPPRLMIFFIVYLLLALMLVVRANIYERAHQWRRQRVSFDPGIELEFLRDGMLISALVVGLVWVLPRPQTTLRAGDFWSLAAGPWNRVQREWNRLYAALTYRDPSRIVGLGPTLTLGGPVSLSTDPVMAVQAPEGHYWRGLVLDRYTGNGWVDTTPGSLLTVQAGADLSDPAVHASRRVITETVTLLRDEQTLLFAAAEPLRVYAATRVQSFPHANEREISAIYIQRPLKRGERYVVLSSVPTVDVEGLRRAGTDYPAHVAERYLQLPDSLPARVRHLARGLAEGQPTPYDQAVAIQYYLRQFTYDPNTAPPPPGQDAVDYFLYGSRQGYCTYFASAMVLMCRVVGLPARIAQGYAPGVYTPGRGVFVVRELDAHAWPEVYFPGYGWIAFEPTPSQDLNVRPASAEALDPGAAAPFPGTDFPTAGALTAVPTPAAPESGSAAMPPARRSALWLMVGAGGLFVAAVGVTGWGLRRRWQATPPAQRLYLRLTWLALPLGLRLLPQQTPLELGQTLGQALGPRGEGVAAEIVRLYLRERFGARAVDEAQLAAAGAAWRNLLPFALLQGLKRRLQRLRDRFRRSP